MLINYIYKEKLSGSIISSSHAIRCFPSHHLDCKKCFEFNIYFFKVFIFLFRKLVICNTAIFKSMLIVSLNTHSQDVCKLHPLNSGFIIFSGNRVLYIRDTAFTAISRPCLFWVFFKNDEILMGSTFGFKELTFSSQVKWETHVSATLQKYNLITKQQQIKEVLFFVCFYFFNS